ncbi:DHH family phosphoesterase [Clostridium sp. Cult2]|uniref:DHH family phosphoesterase n=1 Tax=Clostridium sp. Cult2 TaxID=2079003 RepID=UPI001F197F2F|nr:bifunctional oligoribonuclease/PAP phosphatase NrnA [Clostridium sp. Cult2]MCF6464692.1 bifunctional oligoribonuclease/PAP phosphatase NrnA [Clostridium sp. Cult2]
MNNPIEILMVEAVKLIKKYNNIYIVSHVQPDGDNIGSTLALAMAIKKLKGNVKVIKVDNIPSDYEFLPGIDMIKDYSLDESIELLISLDSSDLDRLGLGKEFALKAKKVINIDHHITNNNFGDINIVSPSSAATGEIIYELIKKMEVDFNKDIATCLYTAISTDTGGFIYSNTTYKTHLIIAELLKLGIDADNININLYQNRSMARTRLFIDSLKKMETFLGGKVGLVVITQEMLKINESTMEDTEGIISFIREIDSIEVACLLKEIDENEVKVSLRSKKQIDVSKICNKFNGGGHVRAAGCTIYEKIYNAKEMILEEIFSNFR